MRVRRVAEHAMGEDYDGQAHELHAGNHDAIASIHHPFGRPGVAPTSFGGGRESPQYVLVYQGYSLNFLSNPRP